MIAAAGRHVEQRARQNPAVGGDDDGRGRARAAFDDGGIAELSGCTTARPRSSASCFTAGLATRPRPAGRSGWVNTPTTSGPRSRSAREDAAANGGVPMKTTRQVASAGGELRCEATGPAARPRPSLALDLLALPLVEIALQARERSRKSLPSRWSISCWSATASSSSASISIFLLVGRPGAHEHASARASPRR